MGHLPVIWMALIETTISVRIVPIRSCTAIFIFSNSKHCHADIDELYEKYATSDSYPSYSYYEEAAATPVPGYRVELAKSNRSQCKSKTGKQLCGGNIQKNSIRVGSLDEKAGSYGRWQHLTSAERRGVGGGCRGWRVPKKVHHGLGNPSDLDQVLKDLMNMEEGMSILTLHPILTALNIHPYVFKCY